VPWTSLIERTREQARMAIMDYGDPETDFTGGLAIEALNIPSIGRSIRAYRLVQGAARYPIGWKKTLDRAREVLLKPSRNFPLVVEAQHDGEGITMIVRTREVDRDPVKQFRNQDL